MNYAILYLKNHSDELTGRLNAKVAEYDNGYYENAFDEEIMLNDIENLKRNIRSVVSALNKLTKN